MFSAVQFWELRGTISMGPRMRIVTTQRAKLVPKHKCREGQIIAVSVNLQQ